MTKQEFLNIKAHTRIKYVGTDPVVLAVLDKCKAAKAKGIVVTYISDYSKSTWGSNRGITVGSYSTANIDNVNTEHWVIVDAERTDLLRDREKRLSKNTDRWVRRELNSFTQQFTNMKSTKEKIDTWLNEVPLAARLKILTGLTPEQKCWLHLLSVPPEELVKVMKDFSESLYESGTQAEEDTDPVTDSPQTVAQ